MYIGLTLMNEKELAEITRLIGVDNPPSSRDILFDIVSGWIARTVKREGRAQEEVERCVLEWTAKSWKILVPDGTDVNDLERALRLKIAKDAADFLAPGWALCCALIAVGKQSNIQDKLDLMEQAAATAVPSSRARAAKRFEWNQLADRWSKVPPGADLEPYIDAVAARPELHTECLTLGLALSLLDGSIAFPTERLYREICDKLGMGRGESDDIKHKVNDLYWKHHNAAVPTQTKEEVTSDPVKSATRRTVYDAGALEVLAAEARVKLFSDLEPGQKKSGWSKLIGGLSGMSPFFSSRMKNDVYATLARVVYHTILKQHDAVVAASHVAHQGMADFLSSEHSLEEERVVVADTPVAASVELAAVPQPTVEPPTGVASGEEQLIQDQPGNLALAEQMVDNAQGGPKRIIKLDF